MYKTKQMSNIHVCAQNMLVLSQNNCPEVKQNSSKSTLREATEQLTT